jgi:hypothetical protein
VVELAVWLPAFVDCEPLAKVTTAVVCAMGNVFVVMSWV